MVNKYKELNRISKKGHSFPHYDTCNTCIDDFDQVIQYALDCVAFAMELRRRGLTLDIENEKNKEFYKGAEQMFKEFALKLSDFEYIKNYIHSKGKYMSEVEKKKWMKK